MIPTENCNEIRSFRSNWVLINPSKKVSVLFFVSFCSFFLVIPVLNRISSQGSDKNLFVDDGRRFVWRPSNRRSLETRADTQQASRGPPGIRFSMYRACGMVSSTPHFFDGHNWVLVFTLKSIAPNLFYLLPDFAISSLLSVSTLYSTHLLATLTRS